MSRVRSRPPRPITRLVLIRHGETEWNLSGRYQGQADPGLTEIGRRQAAALADALKAVRPDMLYSSPLRRAMDTATVIAGAFGLEVGPDPRLMEIHLGRWQGVLKSDIAADDPELFERWRSVPWDSAPPGGEHLTEVRKRVEAAVDDILAAHPGRCIGVVTHRVPMVLLCMRYLCAPANAMRTLNVPNAGWVAVAVRDGRAVEGPLLGEPGFIDALQRAMV